MIAEFSVFPVGRGAHLSQYVAPLFELIEKSGLEYRLTPMGTVVEGEVDEVFELVRACHKKMAEDSERVITSLKIDDFKGAKGRLNGKIESVEKHLGREVKK